MSARHLLMGRGAPTIAPDAVGQHYFDLTNHQFYQSTGSDSEFNWVGPLIFTDRITNIIGEEDPNLTTIEALAAALGNDPKFHENLMLRLQDFVEGSAREEFLALIDELSGGGPYTKVRTINSVDYTISKSDSQTHLLMDATSPIVVTLPAGYSWSDSGDGGPLDFHFEQVNKGTVEFIGGGDSSVHYLYSSLGKIAGVGGVVTAKWLYGGFWVIYGQLKSISELTIEDILTVYSFPLGPQNLLTQQRTLTELPMELFYNFPSGILLESNSMTSMVDVNPGLLTIEEMDLDTPVYLLSYTPEVVMQNKPTRSNGPNILVGSTPISISPSFYSAGTNNASFPLKVLLEVDLEDGAGVFAQLPPTIELSVPKAIAVKGNEAFNASWPEAGGAYMGFRPIPSLMYPLYAYVDNLAFAGPCYLEWTSEWAHSPTLTERNQFVGFLKRGAMGKKVVDYTPDDVVAGILLQGTVAQFIVNGEVKLTRGDVPFSEGYVSMGFSAEPTDTYGEDTTPTQLETVMMKFTEIYIWGGNDDNGDGQWVNQTFAVNWNEAIIAGVTDLDLRNHGISSDPELPSGVNSFYCDLSGDSTISCIKGLVYQQ